MESATPFIDDPYASINAGERVSQGVEVSIDMAVTEQLTLGLSGAILDSVMTDFPGAGCTQVEFLNAVTGPCLTAEESIAEIGDNSLQGTIDRSGEDGPYAPTWSMVVDLDYWVPVFDSYKLTFNAKGYLSDGYFTNSRNFSKALTYNTHGDMSLAGGFADVNDVWELSFWLRNILEPNVKWNADQDPLNNGTVAYPASPGDFMTYGLKFTYNYQ